MTGPLTPDDILAALDPEQHAVASEPSGPMVVVAGAGTGKTRALTHRIAYAVATGVQQPQRVLALTFTARAAGEMRTRLRGLGVVGVQARTFHAAALRQLHYFWPQAIGGPAPEVMPHKAGAVAEALGRLRSRPTAPRSATLPRRSSGPRSDSSPRRAMPRPRGPRDASRPPGWMARPWRACSPSMAR